MGKYYVYIYTDPNQKYDDVVLHNGMEYSIPSLPIYVGKGLGKRFSFHAYHSVVRSDESLGLFYDDSRWDPRNIRSFKGNYLRKLYKLSEFTDKKEWYSNYKANHIVKIDNLTDEEACRLEIDLIKRWKTRYDNSGSLLNYHPGGLGGGHLNFITINDGTKFKRVPPDKLDDFIKLGWELGVDPSTKSRLKELSVRDSDKFVKRMNSDKVLKTRSEKSRKYDLELVSLIKTIFTLNKNYPIPILSKSFGITESVLKDIRHKVSYKEVQINHELINNVYNDSSIMYYIDSKIPSDLRKGLIDLNQCPHCLTKFSKTAKSYRTRFRYHYDNCPSLSSKDYVRLDHSNLLELDKPEPVYDLHVDPSSPCFTIESGIVSHNTIPSTLDYSLCFTPRDDGKLFLHLDLAQAEVRIAFAVAKETNLINAILKGLDIHGLNANNAFNLGFKEDELWKIKEDPITDQLRSYAKMLTFAILYGASPGSIAKQIKKPLEEAQKIYDSYFDANPNFKKFVNDNQVILKDNFGFRELPIFGHDFYIGNPYHYSIKQKGLNYIIQNLSSSICAHSAYMLYRDLKDNYNIDLDIVSFVHDAIELELEAKDMMTVISRIDYWFRIYPIESWGIPNDYDFEVGMSRFSGGKCKIKYNEDRTRAYLDMEILDYYNDKDKILKMIRASHNIVDESIEEVGVADKHPFKFLIEGVKPACRFNSVKTPKYRYKAEVIL